MNPSEIERIHSLEGEHWWYQSLHALLLKKPGKKILDLGCGTGTLLEKFKQNRSCEVLGVDPSPLSASLCQRKLIPQIQSTIQDFFQQEVTDTYDLVLAIDSLYFLSPEEQKISLEQALKLTKAGGLICLQLPALTLFSRGHDKIVGIKKRSTKGEIRRLLNELSIKPAQTNIKYRVQILSLPILLSKFIGRFSQKPSSDLFPLPFSLNKLLLKWQLWEDHLPTLWGSSLLVEIRKI